MKRNLISLIVVAIAVVLGAVIYTRGPARFESFDYPGDRNVKEIKVEYTAKDATTRIRKFANLADALKDLEANGWKLSGQPGGTVVVTTRSRSAPRVSVFAATAEDLVPLSQRVAR